MPPKKKKAKIDPEVKKYLEGLTADELRQTIAEAEYAKKLLAAMDTQNAPAPMTPVQEKVAARVPLPHSRPIDLEPGQIRQITELSTVGKADDNKMAFYLTKEIRPNSSESELALRTAVRLKLVDDIYNGIKASSKQKSHWTRQNILGAMIDTYFKSENRDWALFKRDEDAPSVVTRNFVERWSTDLLDEKNEEAFKGYLLEFVNFVYKFGSVYGQPLAERLKAYLDGAHNLPHVSTSLLRCFGAFWTCDVLVIMTKQDLSEGKIIRMFDPLKRDICLNFEHKYHYNSFEEKGRMILNSSGGQHGAEEYIFGQEFTPLVDDTVKWFKENTVSSRWPVCVEHLLDTVSLDGYVAGSSQNTTSTLLSAEDIQNVINHGKSHIYNPNPHYKGVWGGPIYYFVRRLDRECHRLDTDRDRGRALVMIGEGRAKTIGGGGSSGGGKPGLKSMDDLLKKNKSTLRF